jgi:hypothetical protein
MPARVYSGFGLRIASELDLPGLPPATGHPDVTVRLDRVERSPHFASLDEEVRVFRTVGAFRIRGGREIVVDPLPDSDPVVVRTVLLGTVMAHLMRQRGWLPLHAGGVAVANRALLFLGRSGSGKSTTAAAFFMEGHSVISDDVCAVRVADGQCEVQSAWPRLRLAPDTVPLIETRGTRGELQVDKHSYLLHQRPLAERFSVARIYSLEFGASLSIIPVPPLAAVAILNEHNFSVRRRMNRESLKIHVRDCAAVAGAAPLARLQRPHSLKDIPTMVQAVLSDLTDI